MAKGERTEELERPEPPSVKTDGWAVPRIVFHNQKMGKKLAARDGRARGIGRIRGGPASPRRDTGYWD